MVRTVKNNHHHHHHHQHHNQDEEDDDEDFISRTTDGSSHSQKDGRSNDQKASSHRSKHSETEQRRRSKINERFQLLRDLIPQNDQKRDRASFLLEVIQYIQFLQEKLQVYEGTYQGWSPETTKLTPWQRGNCGVENLADQSQPQKNGSVDGGNMVLTPELFTNVHNLVESALSGSTAFKTADPNTFEPETSHTRQGSFPDVDLLTSQSRPQTWNATSNELEESSISKAYSKGLLNNLTHALGSSGVDLSQASISVQFDIRKWASSGATFGTKDYGLLSSGNQATTHCDQPYKRARTEQNQ